MKLIIDIPEELKNKCDELEFEKAINYVRWFDGTLTNAIENGTPIPDNATNGDVLDKIRAEIIKHFEGCYLEEDMTDERKAEHKAYENVLRIIDKYIK